MFSGLQHFMRHSLFMRFLGKIFRVGSIEFEHMIVVRDHKTCTHLFTNFNRLSDV